MRNKFQYAAVILAIIGILCAICTLTEHGWRPRSEVTCENMTEEEIDAAAEQMHDVVLIGIGISACFMCIIMVVQYYYTKKWRFAHGN